MNYTKLQIAIAELQKHAYEIAKAEQDAKANLAWKQAKKELNLQEVY